MSFVSTTSWKSWSAQRMLNRFPIWSRARTREDSFAAYLINPFGEFIDEVLEQIINVRKNYYITSVDILEQPFAYVLSLPNTFAFSYTENVAGKLTFLPPTVTGTIGLDSLSIEVLEIPTLQAMDKSEVFPTRITSSRLMTSFDDEVIAETALGLLSTASINDDHLSEMGTLYIEVDNAIQFGETLSDGSIVTPKVVILGNPWIEEKDKEEHLVYRTNAERRTANRWDSITSVETRGIFDTSATLRAHTGFTKRVLREPVRFWEDENRETILNYSYDNLAYDYGLLPVIQFLTPEITNISLQEQGFSNDMLEYEFALMLDSTTYFDQEVVGLERMPFTTWFIVATSTQLHFVNSRIPHAYNWAREDVNGNSVIIDAFKNRDPDCELQIIADRHWLNYSEDEQVLNFETRRFKQVLPIKSTRLSITYDSPALPSVVTKYYDWSGNELTLSNDNQQGFIVNFHSDTTTWEEKRFSLDISAEIDHPAWIAIAQLETKFSDNTIEKDVAIFHSDYRTVEKTLDFTEDISGLVDGMTYDAKGRLLVRTTADEVWEITPHYDYAVVDYKRNFVLLREEYDSVEVTS